MADLILHNYYRSSTSFRVRAALSLKGIDYDYESYHLRKGEQRGERLLKLNTQGLVPVLESPEGAISQSLAIIEYLDEIYQEPRLMPIDPVGRARVRSLAMIVACDIHPINNLRVLGYLRANFAADKGAVVAWFRHWVETAFEALESRLSNESQTGEFCHGDAPSMADICLAGQVINNGRFQIETSQYPTIERIHDNCMALDAFKSAHPAMQVDTE